MIPIGITRSVNVSWNGYSPACCNGLIIVITCFCTDIVGCSNTACRGLQLFFSSIMDDVMYW